MHEPKITAEELRRTTDIGNMYAIAHVDRGKVTLTDSLVAAARIIAQETAGGECKAARDATLKSTELSLEIEMNDGNVYTMNLADSTADVDFFLEVSNYSKDFVDKHPDLSKLKPPSRSDGFNTDEESLEALKWASLALISNIKNAANAKKMINLSSKAFRYFDSIGVDYTRVYKAVCYVISHQCDKEALSEQKPHHAYDTKGVNDDAESKFFEAEGRCIGVNRDVKEAQNDIDVFKFRLCCLYDEINMVRVERGKAEAKRAAARARKVTCEKEYEKAKAKLEEIVPKMNEAQKEIDEFERRWKDTADRFDRAMEGLTRLKSSLQ